MPDTEVTLESVKKELDALKGQLTAEQQKAAALTKEIEGKDIAYRRVQQQRDQAQQVLGQIQPDYEKLRTDWQAYNQAWQQDPQAVIRQLQQEATKTGLVVNTQSPGPDALHIAEEEPAYVKQIREQNNALAQMVRQQQQMLGQFGQQMQQMNQGNIAWQQQTVREKFDAALDKQFVGKSFRFKNDAAKQVIYDDIWNRTMARQTNPATGEIYTLTERVNTVVDSFPSAPDVAAEKAKADEAARLKAVQANAGFLGSPATGQDMGGEIPDDWEPETDDDFTKMFDKVEANVASMLNAAPQQPDGEV